MTFKQQPLPYAYDALKPVISEETMHFHYDQHQRGYVDELNLLVKDGRAPRKTLEEIIMTEKGHIHEVAGQVWNHTFYWECMKKNGEKEPKKGSRIHKRIMETFGSLEDFKKQFSATAINLFGSGWAWLVLSDHSSLEIMATHDGENPMSQRMIPLLTIDVWEHAYYIDKRNDRRKYVEEWWNLINWEFVESNLDKSLL